MAISIDTLMLAQTTTGVSARCKEIVSPAGGKTFQTIGRTTVATGSATIAIEGSLDGTNYVVLGHANLTLGTTDTTAALNVTANYKYFRFNVTAISGVGASVDGYAA